jgi:hypothetical protein
MLELQELRSMISEIKQRLAPKRFMSLSQCLPPRDILLRAVEALHVTGNYQGFSEVMTSFYEIDRLPYTFDASQVPEKAIACYYADRHHVYSKAKTMNNHTAFHELFHALVAKNVVWICKDKAEEYADKYADACEGILREDRPLGR